ncbi:MAG: response regulator [Polyangiaceae bacterium]|nr:response regulator [Polyangiaceae bacterium]
MPEHKLAQEVLDSLHEGCQVISPEYRYLYVNDALVRQGKQSREQLLGKTMMECYPGIEQTAMWNDLQACLTDRVERTLENEFTFPDGTRGCFELRFVPVPAGVCILSLDVTASKRDAEALARMQEQLWHAQKMEAVGRLAGGVAHDFNNLLSVISSYTSLMLTDLPSGDPLRDDVTEIHKAAERAAQLTRQLLAFSRRQLLEPRVLDLNQVLGGMENMLRRLLGADVELRLVKSPGLGKVLIDPSSVEQTVMNLAVNARDAMPTGGKLTIETRNVELDEGYADQHFDVTPGAYVMLAMSDTGSGMDRATQARIFEPFFTTKPAGKGTGLGLASVFGTLKQSGGHIWVYSELGKGTTFKVYLPRTRDDAASDPPETPPPESVRGSETLLVVEDDDAVRAVCVNILRRNGYRVLEAPNGGEALMICEQHPATIHLMITDVVLPRMSGRLLAERVAPLRPHMKLLFMSGYTDEAVLQHGILESEVEYLQKPLTPDTLLRKVRQVLSAKRSAPG